MDFGKATTAYMITVILAGLGCVIWAATGAPIELIDVRFLFLVCFTLGLGSRISVRIPRLKSHISVSDTFIFLTLLLYGGHLAVLLAAVEATISSWRFCNKRITVFFNSAALAIATTFVYLVLTLSGLNVEEKLHGRPGYLQPFFIVLSLIAMTQFGVNTALATVYDSLKNALPLWETWKKKYIWTFITYFFGALGAGLLVQISDTLGFAMLFAVVPVILFVFLTYRMYLNNVEISMHQAEQAEEYAKTLELQAVALSESEERFRSAFDYAPIGIALVSCEGRWIRVNRALTDILGYTEEEFLAADFRSMIVPEDLGTTLVKIAEVTSGYAASSQMEHRYVHRSGRTVWASWSVSTVGDAGSRRPNLIFQIQDITDRKLAEERLHHDATHDALTGLANRSLFMRMLSGALRKTQARIGHKVSVLFIDLDRFKNVNDSLGHLVGDRLLITISERLKECLRPSDMVARLGGDEFVILIQGEYENDEVLRIAERIQEKFSVPFNIKEHDIYSSASIGILHASPKHATAEDMMRDADTAMYQAKRAGKARHEVFDEKMHKVARETLRLETELRKAVENDDFNVLYQPIYSLLTGEIESLEALARWHHPDLGFIPPHRFIDLAEEIGLIDALGDKILRRACSEFAGLLNSGQHDLALNVNLSCRQFASSSLVDRIKTLLDETGFSPANLKLEITESVFFEYRQTAIEMLNSLRKMGIEFYIDDFGTGYSNLSYLTTLPISSLKIDRTFISMFGRDGASPAIIQTIVGLAKNLGLRVIAEGVENEEQLKQLRKLDCDAAQGYYFSPPVPIVEIEQFLNTHPRIPVEGLLDYELHELVQ